MKTLRNWLSERPNHIRGIRVLQICLSLVICFRIATELPFIKYLYGINGIATYDDSQSYFGFALGKMLATIFYSSNIGIYCLIVILFTGAMMFLLNIKTRLATFICLFGYIMLFEHRLSMINDGGDNLVRIALIYMLLLLSNPYRSSIHPLKVWFHNIGVAAIIMQAIIIYSASGYLKVAGEKWQNGTAMYIISNVEWFSLPGFRTMFTNPIITTFATYIPQLFMLLFPIAIFSRFKHIWIGAGVVFHLFIAYSMGLVTFSLTMIGLELFLITDKEYEVLKRYTLNVKNYLSQLYLAKVIQLKIRNTRLFANYSRLKQKQ